MLQVGRSIEGICWRKVGICYVVGVWESIRMEMNRGFVVVVVCREGQCFDVLKGEG